MICSEVVDIGLLQCPSCEKKLSEHMMHIKYVLECSFWVDSGHSQVFFLEIFLLKVLKKNGGCTTLIGEWGSSRLGIPPINFIYMSVVFTLLF